jgi:hypothetical protein
MRLLGFPFPVSCFPLQTVQPETGNGKPDNGSKPSHSQSQIKVNVFIASGSKWGKRKDEWKTGKMMH